MAKHHIPRLGAIQTLPNKEIRFYATVGAAISLAAGLELSFLDIFQKATGMDRELAALIMYNNRNASYRRDAADVAMLYKLRKSPKLADWEAIRTRIVAATGKGGARNLVGHTAVSKTTIQFGGAYGEDSYSEAPYSGTMSEEQFFVEQDQDKVLAGIEKARKEDFASLLTYCTELIKLIGDIDDFLNRL